MTSLVVVAALGLAGIAEGGGAAPVRDGRYAGGGDKIHVYFDVQSRSIPYARVYSSELKDCTGLNGPGVFDDTTVEANGKFSLRDADTHAGNTIKVSGRFVRKDFVRGKLRWTTNDLDCPGTHTFDYKADRHAPVP